ncbi:MAG: PAS domain-containing protein [Bacteroidota bacterium]
MEVAESQVNAKPVARKLDIQTCLIDAKHDLCFVLSTDYSILYGNRKGTKALGRSEKRLQGQDFSLLIHQADRTLFRRSLELLWLNQSTDLEVTIDGQGKTLFGEARVHRTKIAEGEVFVLTIQDLTADRKKELVDESERKRS